jgi:serine protease AprX
LSRVTSAFAKVIAVCLWLSVTVAGQGGSSVASLSGDLLALLLRGASTKPVRVIVRGDVQAIQNVAARDGFTVRRVLDGFVVLDASPSALYALRHVPGIEAISRDARVSPLMTVSAKTMAADQARASAPGLLGIGAYPAVTGRGVGVAVVDSGIAAHAALAQKVVASVSFVTGDPSTDDKFGHGTHIAGIIAGDELPAAKVTSLYKGGIAPGAHLINVRVLGNQGSGYTSDVIAGIQWTITNRARYNIRVVNLSLGHPSVEPCLTDPLCLAVEKAAMAGLVVVASAGNNGKDAAGTPVMASITTPGIAPSAITVGALNTWGTVSRDDDTVATYSSKGPTKYELGLKPDVVAPGNKIVSLEVPGSYLARQYPSLHVAGSGNNAYYTMSGTSMAAAMVSGGAALLLEGGVLTAKQIKLSLQLSSSFMADEGLLVAGTGSVNLWAARRINGTLQSLTGVLPAVTIGGKTVRPSGLVVNNSSSLVDRAIAPVGMRGIGALELLQGFVNPSKLTSRIGVLGLLNPLTKQAPGRLIWGDLYDRLPGNQLIWGDHSVGQQLIWGDQTLGQQLIWGDQTIGQQLIWGDRVVGQQLIWGDQTLGQQLIWGDQTMGQQLIWGDQTAGQQLIWGDQTGSTGQLIIWGDADTSNSNQLIWGDSVPKGQ